VHVYCSNKCVYVCIYIYCSREVSMTSSLLVHGNAVYGAHMCIYIAVTKPGRGQAALGFSSAALGFSSVALLQLLYFSCFT
jgi:hypothetical protein